MSKLLQKTVYIREDQERGISQLLRSGIAEGRVHPESTFNAMHRHLLDYAIDNAEISEVMPEHVQILNKRDAFKNGEGQLRSLRTGFEAIWIRHFKSRFKSGIKPEELDKFAVNAREDAEMLFPGDEHKERREECLEFVEDLLNETKIAIEVSDYDALDIEEIYTQFAGVAAGIDNSKDVDEEIEDSGVDMDALVSSARALMTSRLNGSSTPALSPERTEARLMRYLDAPESVAREAVDTAIDSMPPEQRPTRADEDGSSDRDRDARDQQDERPQSSNTPTSISANGMAGDEDARMPSSGSADNAVDVDEEEADWLVEGLTDGGHNLDDEDDPVTDGGVDKSPGQEGYWSDLAEAADGEDVPPTVRSRIVDQLDHEEIHGISGSVRRGDTVYCIVSYTESRPSGDVIQLRTVVVDIEAGTAKISDNGMWWPADHTVSRGVAEIMAQTSTVQEHGLDATPMTRDSEDVDLNELLDQEMISDEYRRPDEWGRSWGNGEGPPPQMWDLVDRLDEAGLPTDRFSRLDFGQKTPFERYANRPASELLGNYGVETGLPSDAPADEMDERVLRGDELVIVDVDYPEDAPLDELPETYAVSSANGSDERAHHYYRVPNKSALADAISDWKARISDVDRDPAAISGWKAQPGWGDIWLAGEYVVGPGSYDDESGGRYNVVADVPISTLDAEELIELIDSDDGDLDQEDETVDEIETTAAPDPDPEPEPVEETDDSEDEDDRVECHDCGSMIPRSDAGGDLVDGESVWICAGGCDTESDDGDELATDGGQPVEDTVDDEDRVRTRGIESAVYSDDEEGIGHVVMLDYDDVDRETVMRDAEEIYGPTVVLSSSPGSWHLYGLQVCPWEHVVHIARRSAASETYVDEMIRRGEMTLRIDSKGDKPEPTVEAIELSISASGLEISEPHLSELRKLADDDLRLLLRGLQAGTTHEPVGEMLRRSSYETDTEE